MAQLQPEKSLVLPIFNITTEGFLELQKAGLNLDQLFYLETISHGLEIKELVTKDKIMTWRQSLLRRGLITEDGEVTVEGKIVLEAVGSGEPFKGSLEKKSDTEEVAFEKWWTMYPSSDAFEHKGRKFEGVRGLKRLKNKCKDLFIGILNEGKYTAGDLYRVLEHEILLKKDASVKSWKNEMKYMVNTHSYLYQRGFEGLMEASKTTLSPSQTFEDL